MSDDTPLLPPEKVAPLEIPQSKGETVVEDPLILGGVKDLVMERPAQTQSSVESTLPAPKPVTLQSSSIAPQEPLRTPLHRYRRELGRLKGIAIKNYRAFRGPFELDLPKGENALIYGENGAGKSSLFHSIRDFLEAPHCKFRVRTSPEDEGLIRAISITDNQYRPKIGDPSIELDFEHGSYAWKAAFESDSKRRELATPWNPVIVACDKVKGFLDYRALLRVHYFTGEPGQRIDIFSLLLEQLLPHYTYSHVGNWYDSVTGQFRTGERSFSQGWADLKRKFNFRQRRKVSEEFQPAKKAFDEALQVQVETHLAARASALAQRFDPILNIAFK